MIEGGAEEAQLATPDAMMEVESEHVTETQARAANGMCWFVSSWKRWIRQWLWADLQHLSKQGKSGQVQSRI